MSAAKILLASYSIKLYIRTVMERRLCVVAQVCPDPSGLYRRFAIGSASVQTSFWDRNRNFENCMTRPQQLALMNLGQCPKADPSRETVAVTQRTSGLYPVQAEHPHCGD